MTKSRDDRNWGKVLHFTQDQAFYARMGGEKRRKNDSLSAITRYMEALRMDPMDLETRLDAAEVLTDMLRFNDSNKLLIPYMHLDEEFRKEAYRIVGFNLLGLNEPDGARGAFNRFFDLTDEVSERTDAVLDAFDYIDSLETETPTLMDASDAEYTRLTGEAQDAFDRGDYEGSAKTLRLVAKEHPDDRRVLYDLALSCLCSHKPDESIGYLDTLLKKDGSDWEALALKLMCLKGRRNELERKKIVKKLSECDSDQPDVLYRVNGALIESDCAEAGLRSARALVKLLPYDTLSNHRLALCLIKQKQYKKAAFIYEKLLKIDRYDFIAHYYRSACLDAQMDASSTLFKEKPMLQYQLPFVHVMEIVTGTLNTDCFTAKEMSEKWETDEHFRMLIRWAFSLHEYNISYAMINMLRLIGGESAQMCIREAIADIDANRASVNEAMGALKKCGAEEPFYAILGGSLIEGRVNLIDLSNIKIPKAYLEIFPRFRDSAKDLYPNEVLSSGAIIAERYIAGTNGVFKPLNELQSAAMSAAIEYLACEHCGILVNDSFPERYGVSMRRVTNAIDRIAKVFFNEIKNIGDTMEEDPEGDDGV